MQPEKHALPTVQAAQSTQIMALIPTDLEGVGRLAQMVAQSGLAPKGLESPQAIGTAILYGLEIGMKPMAAIQKIAVINGRATIWGDAALALVMASGQLDDIEETIEGDKASCTVARKGRKPVTRTFTKEDAVKAGLWDERPKVKRRFKNGDSAEVANDSPWFRFSKRMLQMRARGWALRDTFPDVLGGLNIREEIEDDIIDVTPNEAPPEPPPPPGGNPPSANEPPRPPEPPAPAEEEPPAPPAPSPEAIRAAFETGAPPPPLAPQTAEEAALLVDDWRNLAGGATSLEELDERWNARIEPIVDALELFAMASEAVRLYRLNKGRLSQ